MVQMMLNSIRDDLLEALQNLPGPDLDALAEEVKARHKSWGGVLAVMDNPLEEDARKKAWEWVHERLRQANDDPQNDEDLRLITKFRHLRYALAHCLFFYGESMPT